MDYLAVTYYTITIHAKTRSIFWHCRLKSRIYYLHVKFMCHCALGLRVRHRAPVTLTRGAHGDGNTGILCGEDQRGHLRPDSSPCLRAGHGPLVPCTTPPRPTSGMGKRRHPPGQTRLILRFIADQRRRDVTAKITPEPPVPCKNCCTRPISPQPTGQWLRFQSLCESTHEPPDCSKRPELSGFESEA